MLPGGRIYVDCQGIPGQGSYVLFPSGTYAKAKGVWFLPTKDALYNWLKRAGFRDIYIFYGAALSVEEQRRVEPWANVDSLAQFLAPEDPTKTVEGYPAPWRFYALAKRG